jgi:hypothetical protein
MNMISTGSFLTEMDASNKQSELVKTLTAAWEKKNSKAARAGGVSLMALSLAACGSSDDSSDLTASDGTVYTSVDAAFTAGAASVDITSDNAAARAEGVASVDITSDNAAARAEGVASVDITTDNAAATSLALRNAAAEQGVTGTAGMTDAELITAILTANDATIASNAAAAVDITTDNAAAINTAVAADTAFDSLSELVTAYNNLASPDGTTTVLTTSVSDFVEAGAGDDTIVGFQDVRRLKHSAQPIQLMVVRVRTRCALSTRRLRL